MVHLFFFSAENHGESPQQKAFAEQLTEARAGDE